MPGRRGRERQLPRPDANALPAAREPALSEQLRFAQRELKRMEIQKKRVKKLKNPNLMREYVLNRRRLRLAKIPFPTSGRPHERKAEVLKLAKKDLPGIKRKCRLAQLRVRQLMAL